MVIDILIHSVCYNRAARLHARMTIEENDPQLTSMNDARYQPKLYVAQGIGWNWS